MLPTVYFDAPLLLFIRSRQASYLGDDTSEIATFRDYSFDQGKAPSVDPRVNTLAEQLLPLAQSGSPTVFESDTLVLPNCGR
jgi:hypothetical protein